MKFFDLRKGALIVVSVMVSYLRNLRPIYFFLSYFCSMFADMTNFFSIRLRQIDSKAAKAYQDHIPLPIASQK